MGENGQAGTKRDRTANRETQRKTHGQGYCAGGGDGGGNRGEQGGAVFSAEYRDDQFLDYSIYPFFRMEDCVCGSGFYSDGRRCLWLRTLVGYVSVCLAFAGAVCMAVSDPGIRMVLEYPFRCIWAAVRIAVRRSLCGNRHCRRRNKRRPDRRVYLVGGGHSMGYCTWNRKFRSYAVTLPSCSNSHETGVRLRNENELGQEMLRWRGGRTLVSVLLILGQGKGEDKFAPCPFRADDIDVLFMAVYNLFYDGQAQACSFFVPPSGQV